MRLCRIWAGACLVLVVAACGGSLTLSEYAAEAEDLTTKVIVGLETLDAEWEAQAPTLEGAWVYWDRRVAFRVEFLEGIQALDPPNELTDLHETGLDIFSRLTAAEEALAARVDTFETVADLEQMWETPEGRAARAADEEGIAICHAAQAGFDVTEDRDALESVPWIPAEMKEIVRVAFGCPS